MTALAYATTRQTPSPRQRPYRPYGAALDLFYCQADEVVLEGPAGTGKSRADLEKVHLCALKYPGMRALICRKTRASMTESTLVTYEDKVLPVGFIRDDIKRSNRHSYPYPNGSEVVIGGLDKASRIMSTEYDMIVVPEATEATEHDWESLTTRLRNGVMPYQQIIADCNPDAPTHWLHIRCDTGKATVFFSRHTDNPTVTATYLARLENLTGVRKDRLFYGRRAAAEGIVYADFDRRVHLIDRFPIPAVWRRIRAVDFGYSNPFVCQWWAIDPDGRMYLYREIYHTKRTVTVHTKQIKALSEGEKIEATVADHDAEDRATMHEGGIETKAARKAISVGIQKVQERLKLAGDGKPRLYVLRDSLVEADPDLQEAKQPLCFEQEIDSYVWPKGGDGKPVKEVPVDAFNHAMDSGRYAVMYVDNPTPTIARNRGRTNRVGY
jgi:PBSX family phage terminase large subunit